MKKWIALLAVLALGVSITTWQWFRARKKKKAAKRNLSIEEQAEQCKRMEGAEPLLQGEGSLNATFAAIIDPAGAFAHLEPEVLGRDPWVVVFNKFLTPEEVEEYDNFMFVSRNSSFQPSTAGFSMKSSNRNSETAFCTGACDTMDIVKRVQRRVGGVLGAPESHIDFTQAVRYKPGMFFKNHHDNHPTFHLLPCGSRVFTLFVYLKSSEEGGETEFPDLGIKVPPTPGTAVLWPNTRVGSDMNRHTDDRTRHASLSVNAGEKHGLNFWVYQYPYREFWAKSCVSIQFADRLAAYLQGKKVPDLPTDEPHAAKPAGVKLAFENRLDSKLAVFWDSGETEVSLGTLAPGEAFSWDTTTDHVFVVRDATGGLVTRVVVEHTSGSKTVVLSPVAEPGGEEL